MTPRADTPKLKSKPKSTIVLARVGCATIGQEYEAS